ncbi:radical SAM protein [Streptomyces sp. NRRL S-495]|uniref:radical SAM/SPASM domain-containing protein n=1 Tax=Streptomyces sp. NRRL S-495 TaxID=1609133 RepID=UPI00099E071D|nr:radical SAM protein [Streptomyces sp. NRRL S-495]
MHADHIDDERYDVDDEGQMGSEGRGLDFLWLELTNRCNLKCVHCYTESHPGSGDKDLLTALDYESIMNQAYDLGCRKIQFIGGEPQLNPDFPGLLSHAKEVGFEFVEVFTNLTRLTENVLRFAVLNGVRFATSVYSHDSATHDAITTVRSSHAKTVANLKRLIDSEVETRASIIGIRQNDSEVRQTEEFLRDLGVGSVRISRVREFGRGEEVTGQRASMSALCGHCWSGKLCIAPDGTAYPCVMARQWPVGDVLEDRLESIVNGTRLEKTRKEIFHTAWIPKTTQPVNWCEPCSQSCDPDLGSCSPNQGVCSPFSCPQSCHPGIQR